MILMAVGVVLGGLDRVLGNRLGLGEQFEKGFTLLGPTALSMAGMICLAPVLARGIGGAVGPLCRAVGLDPAMFGGLLAIDMGGYELAHELASDPTVGAYAGLVVSATFGCTLVYTIPVGMGMIPEDARPPFARGIMLGLTAMPAGLVVGGAASGLALSVCLYQTLPIFALALLLLLGLWKAPRGMERGFCLLAGAIRVAVTAGLVLGAVEYLTGWNPVEGMAPIEDAMAVVASIGVVMLGSLPLAELLRRALERPFTRLGGWLGVRPQALTGMLVSTVSALPTLAMFDQMDRRGQVAAGAFLVSGVSLLSAHLGFTAAARPELLGAVIAGKITGAVCAAALALCARRPFPE